MSVHPTTKKNTLRAIVAAGTILLTSFGATGVASATESPSTTKVDGNPNCASLGKGYSELKIDPVPQGRSGRSGFTINVSDRVFNWSSTQGVDVVIVKGGPNALIYTYSREATSGNGLHAPTNPSNGQYYGLSHISFCVDAGGDTPPPPKPPTCPAGESMDSQGKCVTPPKPPTCPAGESMDSQGKCVTPPKPPTCPQGHMMNDAGECVAPPAPPECPQGQTMNGRGECVDPPKPPCPEGKSMNTAGECVTPPAPPTCPQGHTMNDLGECVPPKQDDPQPQPPVVLSTPPAADVAAVVDSRAAAPAAQAVLGIRGVVNRIAATARMRGPRQCVSRPFSQVLEGKGIKRVTIYVNGRKVRTMAGGRSTYSVRIDPRRERSGVMRVAAKVEFVAASGKRAQTIRMTALRCAKGAQQVKFAG